MPAWWGRKSTKKNKKKEEENGNNSDWSNKSSIIDDDDEKEEEKSKNNNKKNKNKSKRLDEEEELYVSVCGGRSGITGMVLLSRNSPRNSKDFTTTTTTTSCGGFSGFDSVSASADGGGGGGGGHPLPQPQLSLLSIIDHQLHPHGHGSGCISVSTSVSSASSSSSSYDDPNNPTPTHLHSTTPPGPQLGPFIRGHGESKFNPVPQSPGTGSRGATTATSPLHPRFSGMSLLDSPTGKLEDGKIEGHRLPLPPGSPTPTSPSALPNTRICGGHENPYSNFSKWKKGRLLGRGTFGHVYIGFNSESGQMCAIKEVRVIADDQTSKECLKQLNQEIVLLSQLSHPNIVQYYGSELREETLSVYLEYVSGGSIHKLLQEYGPFREPVIQNYTRQLLSGLAYLHGRNTVHRDIKGANILVDPNGEIKLADFGMAKHITSCSSMLSFKGSPYWMAPEVVMNTNGYSLAVDIWSLGCTILEMATSKPPWSQYEGVAAIFKIGNSKDIPEIPDHLSIDAKSFLKLCLQREPASRLTALQLLDHPFVRDQTNTRVANVNITKEAFPYSFQGSRTPPAALELRSNRMNNFCDGDYATKSAATTTSKALLSPRDSARMITSLPVSPSSSPLRQYGPAYKSCFLSPPHPSYTLAGKAGYNSIFPTKPCTKYTIDPWLEIPQFKAQTPGRSPRTRPFDLV